MCALREFFIYCEFNISPVVVWHTYNVKFRDFTVYRFKWYVLISRFCDKWPFFFLELVLGEVIEIVFGKMFHIVRSELFEWCEFFGRQRMFVFWRNVTWIRHTCLKNRYQSHQTEVCEWDLDNESDKTEFGILYWNIVPLEHIWNIEDNRDSKYEGNTRYCLLQAALVEKSHLG